MSREQDSRKKTVSPRREEQLIMTAKRFLKQREMDRVSRMNGELPPKQRRLMDSLIKQAAAMSEGQEG